LRPSRSSGAQQAGFAEFLVQRDGVGVQVVEWLGFGVEDLDEFAPMVSTPAV